MKTSTVFQRATALCPRHAVLLFLAVGFVQYARADAFTEDFESYTAGSWPSSNWVPSANAYDVSHNQVVSSPGGRAGKSLKLFGQIGGCWGALGFRSFSPGNSFDVEFDIYNGSETLSGCHAYHGNVGLRHGTDWPAWSNYPRNLIIFQGDGTIRDDAGGVQFGTFQVARWYHVKISYRRSGNQLTLSYWLDGQYLGQSTQTITNTSGEDSLDHFELTAQEGSVWFDNIRVVTGTQLRPPYGLTAQWGQVVPGFLNAVLAWQHPGQKSDGTNSDGVVKYRVYLRTFRLDVDCELINGWIPHCTIARQYELEGEVPGDKLGAVLSNLEDLAEIWDGWEFAVSAVDGSGRESAISDPVAVLPWNGAAHLPLSAPRQPIIFVPGYHGDSNTWRGAAEKLHDLYGWTNGEIAVTGTGAQMTARLVKQGNMYRFTFPNNVGSLREQGDQLEKIIKAIVPSLPDKAILAAHSFGGLASRSYLQLTQQGKPNRVSRLVTYGTPHPGVYALPLIDQRAEDLSKATDLIACGFHVPVPYFGQFGTPFDPLDLIKLGIEQAIIGFINPTTTAVSNAAPNSDFMRRLSDFRSNPLPTPSGAGIAYVSLRGRLSLLTKPIVAAASVSGFLACDPARILADARAVESSFHDTDLLFDSNQQDMAALAGISSNVPRSQIKVYDRNPVIHALPEWVPGNETVVTEGGDYISVLMGVGYPVLSIQVHSPVTVAVLDPQGQIMTPQFIGIPGATYTPSGGVEIPMPLNGNYVIAPIPDPSADPNNTFTIETVLDGQSTIIASNQRIQDIPQNGYNVEVAPQLADEDGDGVPDISDLCPGTSNGNATNADGCSIAQLVPCAGPATGGVWKTHGDYVSAVAKKADEFLAAGLITQAQKDAIVAQAAGSNCGGKK